MCCAFFTVLGYESLHSESGNVDLFGRMHGLCLLHIQCDLEKFTIVHCWVMTQETGFGGTHR